MSLMRCDNCGRIVDTDDDPEAMVETPKQGQYDAITYCLCEPCREESDDE